MRTLVGGLLLVLVLVIAPVFASESFYGVWLVEEDIITPGVFSIDQVQVDELIGTLVFLCPDVFRSYKGGVVRDVHYVKEHMNPYQFYKSWRFDLTHLGITDDAVQVIRTEDQRGRSVGNDEGVMGTFVAWGGEDSLFGMTGGVFFHLKRTDKATTCAELAAEER